MIRRYHLWEKVFYIPLRTFGRVKSIFNLMGEWVYEVKIGDRIIACHDNELAYAKKPRYEWYTYNTFMNFEHIGNILNMNGRRIGVVIVANIEPFSVPHFFVFDHSADIVSWRNPRRIMINENKYFGDVGTLSEEQLKGLVKLLHERNENCIYDALENNWQYLIYTWNKLNAPNMVPLDLSIPDYINIRKGDVI